MSITVKGLNGVFGAVGSPDGVERCVIECVCISESWAAPL